MDHTALQALQAPLKERYRDDPEAAVVTLRASGSLDEGISCSVDTGRAIAQAGLHPATGGDGSQLCSGDMLLEALAACAGVTLRAVATSLSIPVQGGTVTAEGDLDFRGIHRGRVALRARHTGLSAGRSSRSHALTASATAPVSFLRPWSPATCTTT